MMVRRAVIFAVQAVCGLLTVAGMIVVIVAVFISISGCQPAPCYQIVGAVSQTGELVVLNSCKGQILLVPLPGMEPQEAPKPQEKKWPI